MHVFHNSVIQHFANIDRHHGQTVVNKRYISMSLIALIHWHHAIFSVKE